MSLAAHQHFWARFYTEPELRKRALSDPEAVAAEFGIAVEVVRETAGPGQPGMEIFTNALVRKRYKQAAALLPGTAMALGDTFGRSFGEYARHSPIPDLHRYEADALAFATGLAEGLDEELRCLLRYECTLLRWQARPPRLAWRWFSYPVLKMVKDLWAGKRDQEYAKRRTLLLTWRRRGEQRFWGRMF